MLHREHHQLIKERLKKMKTNIKNVNFALTPTYVVKTKKILFSPICRRKNNAKTEKRKKNKISTFLAYTYLPKTIFFLVFFPLSVSQSVGGSVMFSDFGDSYRIYRACELVTLAFSNLYYKASKSGIKAPLCKMSTSWL